MKLTIEVDTSNAAFDGSMSDCADEVWRVLGAIPARIAAGDDAGNLRDVNGNTVGTWEYK